ncbi:4-hydroxyphenylacetate 3-hydroxylase N-terminal domain-containing protein [Streptomyces sp. NPDC057486]|uniref:4-hydroxyphenylacetate 3-hydroxylase N-terminal domain-containing protein n=1 Tax=Streptomyces sp. NPDC057486 TaxID=3346145 RepID=UPI00367D48F6
MTTAALPRTATKTARPQTGEEYLESLRDDREVWIYGDRIEDVTTHPAYRNSARSIARLYDALHDPDRNTKLVAPTDTGNDGYTHAFFKTPRTKDELRAGRDAVLGWQELVHGWMGRTPDYKAALLTTLGADPDFFGEYAANAERWYRRAQEDVLHIGHAIVHPPVDRDKGVEEVGDVFIHVEEETDNGLIVSGAKVVATGSPLTQYVFISHFGATLGKKEFALIFMAPTGGQGVKFFSRASYEAVAAKAAGPFDYPLSSRYDENDSIIVLDRALIPWENVLVYDPQKVTRFNEEADWSGRAALQASSRLMVKLDFITGLVSKALDITGSGQFRGVQAGLGEIMAFRHMVAGLNAGMIEDARPGFGGAMAPSPEFAFAFAALTPGMYTRMKQIVETIIASGLIYLNSNAIDFDTPEVRPYLDRFLRGSGGRTALDRSKVMKALWDSIGSEFGSRHELYELNYWGQPEKTYLDILGLAQRNGGLERARGYAEGFMSDYDLKGWTVPHLITPSDVTTIRR